MRYGLAAIAAAVLAAGTGFGADPPPPAKKGFVVEKAIFGAEGRWADVTDNVRRRVRDGRLSMGVPLSLEDLNAIGFPDSFPNRIKTLVVVYTVDGKVGVDTAAQQERLDLPRARK